MKVAAKLHWNSRDDSIVGHSMTADEMATLRDLYAVLNNESQVTKADYILQTLWRDTSSNCDIVGPYYSSCGGFKAKYMITCLMDSLQKLDSFGFRVSMPVVDDASANLSILRLLMELQVFSASTVHQKIHTEFPHASQILLQEHLCHHLSFTPGNYFYGVYLVVLLYIVHVRLYSMCTCTCTYVRHTITSPAEEHDSSPIRFLQ